MLFYYIRLFLRLALKPQTAMAIVVTMGCGIMQAQRPSRLDSLLELPEVVVSKRLPQEIIPAQKLKGEALQKLNSYSVADAVRYFSGVQLKDYGGVGGLKTINVRSMGTNHMGVFYNGIQLGNAQNGQIDLGKFSLDNIEEIALYNGQRSSMLQSAKDYGSAGTLYLQTRHPLFAEGETHHLVTKVRIGSFRLIAPSVLWEQKLTNNISYNLSAEFLDSDGKYKFRYRRLYPQTGNVAYDTIATRQNGDIRALRLEGSLFGRVPDGEWNAHAYYYQSKRGLPGPIVKNVFSHGQRLEDRSAFIQAKYKQDINSWYSVAALAKVGNDYNHYVDNEWTSPVYVDNQYLQREGYLSVAHKLQPYRWLSFNIANDLQYNVMDANLVEFAYPKRVTLLTAVASQALLGPVKVQIAGLYTCVRERVKAGNAAPNKDIITPSVFFSWRVLETNHRLMVNGFYKDIFRMPTFNDLYYTFIGSANLAPEYTRQYDLGLDYSYSTASESWIKEARAKLDIYYNTVRNKIVAMPAGNMFRWTMVNLGKVRIVGAETNLGVTLIPLKGLTTTVDLTYTYQKAQDVTNPKDYFYGHQIPYIPWHSGSALVAMDYKDWGLNYSFIYTGTRYTAKANDLVNKALPWYTNDVGLRKDWQWGKHQLRTQLDINNLLNQHYDVVLNYPMPGRNYRLTIQYTL